MQHYKSHLVEIIMPGGDSINRVIEGLKKGYEEMDTYERGDRLVVILREEIKDNKEVKEIKK